MNVVLFDIDGTLLRGAGQHHKLALLEGIRRVTGVTATFDGIDTAGRLDGDLIRCLLDGAAGDLPALMEACQQAYVENCRADLRPFVCPGVTDLLERLREAGAAAGLVTGNLSAIGWKKMELAGLRSYFTFGAFAEDGETRTELARIAVSRARASAGTRVTLVGDHANDIAAAKANGYRSAAVATGVMSRTELARYEPDVVVGTLEELSLAQICE